MRSSAPYSWSVDKTSSPGPSSSERAAIEAAAQAQQARLADDYRQAVGMLPPTWTDTTPGAQGIALAQAARLSRERLPRSILALLIALALGRLVFGSLPRWKTRLLAGAIFLLVFGLGYVLVSQKTFSLSSVTSVTSLLVTAGGWGLAAGLVSAAFFAWRAGLRSEERAQRTRSPRSWDASPTGACCRPIRRSGCHWSNISAMSFSRSRSTRIWRAARR